MTARILDGKKLAESLRAEVKAERRELRRSSTGRPPGLDVVLVGEDPASVSLHAQQGEGGERGRHARHAAPAPGRHRARRRARARRKLNADDDDDGILVQLPLPKHIREATVLDAIDPSKDVDGFLPMNAGLLATGRFDRALVPCTPRGCMKLLELAGREARRRARRRGRAQQHRRQAGRAAAARGERHGDDRALAHARSRRRVPRGRRARRRRGQARRWCAATGSSPAPSSSTSA